MDDSTLKRLALARQHRADIRDCMKMAVSAITSTPEYKGLEGDLQAAMAEEADALTAVKDAAFAEFEKDGNKKPHDKVAIKHFTDVLVTDEDKLRAYCLVAFHAALKVDDKIVESAAKQRLIPADYFTETDRYEASIATDLSSLLPVV
jgi:hypothetical protein